MESEKETHVTKDDLLNLPSTPLKLKGFADMAQIMIDNGLYKNDKKKSIEKCLQELELKLYYCDVNHLPAIFANDVYIVYGNFSVMLKVMDWLVGEGCVRDNLHPIYEMTVNEKDHIFMHVQIRPTSSKVPFDWTVPRAEQAGNTRGIYWQRDPQAALRNACWKDIYRTLFRNYLGGCIYTPDEFGLDVDADGNVLSTGNVKTIPKKGK